MGNTDVTLAEKGTMEMTADKRYLLFTLSNGINYSESVDNRKQRSNHPLQRTKFKEDYRRFDLSGFTMSRTNEEFFKDNYQMMNISQLKASHDSLKLKYDTIKDQYIKSLNSNLYYYTTYCDENSDIADTSKPLTGELLDNFKKNEKFIIVDKAMNMARGMKDHVFFSNEDLKGRQKFITRHEIEWHRKFTLSIACIVLFFIGAPLGAIIRKGGLGLPVVV